MKKISEGAEAIVYETSFMGIPAIVKDRIAKSYREKTLDEEIRTQRTKNEARILQRASSNLINTPTVLLVKKHQICMTKLKGKNLNTISNSSAIAQAGRLLSMLHAVDIIHGDYTPANIMVQGSEVSVIDFGLGEISNSIEQRALDVLLMKRSITKVQYSSFMKAYVASYPKSREVLARLSEIEKRGRYQTRTLIAQNDSEA